MREKLTSYSGAKNTPEIPPTGQGDGCCDVYWLQEVRRVAGALVHV
jgi:hypothetical protein